MSAEKWKQASVWQMMELRLSSCCNQYFYMSTLMGGTKPCDGVAQCSTNCPTGVHLPFSTCKSGLFTVACARYAASKIQHNISDLLDSAERMAEGGATPSTLREVAQATLTKEETTICRICNYTSAQNAYHNAIYFLYSVSGLWRNTRERKAERDKVTDILRDILGNPFQPVTIDQRKITRPLRGMIAYAYENLRPDGTLDPENLAVLSDAVEDEGFPQVILDDLRVDRPRYRGAWSLDLLRGIN